MSVVLVQGAPRARAELVTRMRAAATDLGVTLRWVEDVGLAELVSGMSHGGVTEPIGPAPAPAQAPDGPGLSRRELQILGFVAGGSTNREIAATLGLAPNTVKTYWQRALRKLGARNRAQAIVRAHERQLLPEAMRRAS